MSDLLTTLRGGAGGRFRAVLALVALAGSLLFTLSTPASSAQTPTGTLSDPVLFTGGGWGHGVGMSQYGAYGRGAAGHTAAQILAHYYQGTTLGAYPVTNDVRVRLARVNEVVFEPTAPLPLVLDGVTIGSAPGGSSVRVLYTGTGVQVEVAGLCAPGACVGTELIAPLTVDQPVRVSSTGHRYHRGRLRARPDGSAMLVLNDGLTMDAYLYGLSEVPSSWPAATLQAQAIAGRSYAESRVAARRASGTPYDLFATTADQAFTGYEKERGALGGSWAAAVDATSTQVLTSGGTPITAFYTSSNGGHSENSEYAFVETLSYARGAPDSFDSYQNPFGSWQREYTIADMSRWLAQATDTNVGTIRAIEMTGPFGVSGRNDKANVRLIGSTATRTVTGTRFRTVMNSGIVADGGGLSRQILSTNYSIANVSYVPEGVVELVQQTGNVVTASGWAIDRNSTGPVSLHFYVNGAFLATGAPAFARPDINALTGRSVPSGFSVPLAIAPGTHQVCVFVINVGPPEPNPNIGCRNVTVTDRIPFGNNESITADRTSITWSGWVFDPDAPSASIEVHAWAGGSLIGATLADRPRPDVAAAFTVGPNHGYSITTVLPPGLPTTTPICLHAINAGPGTANPAIICRSVGQIEKVAIGTIDLAEATRTTVRFAGWVADGNNLDASTDVHFWANGSFLASTPATTFRPDVAAAFRVRGNYGYDATIPLPPGLATNAPICAYAINIGPSTANPLIGCRTLDQLDRQPAGIIEVVEARAGRLFVAGWVGDRDALDFAVALHVYVDGVVVGAGTTTLARPDVTAARGLGPLTGFGFDVPLPVPGRHQVCLFAINAGPGSVNPNLGCRIVQI